MGLCASSSVSKSTDPELNVDVANPASAQADLVRNSLPPATGLDNASGGNTSSAEQKVKNLLNKRRARKKVVVNVTDNDNLDDSAAAELAASIAQKSKTDEDKAWIRSTLADKFFLFNDLDADMQNALIMCFEKKEYAPGGRGGLAATVIQQGETGDYMYIIEKGTFAVDVDGENVATLCEGGLFGELALLYDATRAASVVATSDAVVWRVGRREFKFAVRLAAKNSRTTISETLGKVEIFKNLGAEQIAAVASALEVSPP